MVATGGQPVERGNWHNCKKTTQEGSPFLAVWAGKARFSRGFHPRLPLGCPCGAKKLIPRISDWSPLPAFSS